MDKMIFLIDSGHGGFINGQYQTQGKFHKFPDGEIAYEGVINRAIKQHTMFQMERAGFQVIDVCPTEMDLSLKTRCTFINGICDEFGANRCLLISLHSNAGGGRGFEIWTTPGKTASDDYATIYTAMFTMYFPDIPLRTDYSDGDPDKEANFYILQNSKCPAILPEFLFFDNKKDWEILKQPATHRLYADMIVEFAKHITR